MAEWTVEDVQREAASARSESKWHLDRHDDTMARNQRRTADMLDAYADLLERTTWQPIETAPKDGTEVLVWWPGFHVTVGWIHDRCGRWANTECGCDLMSQPTHWLPLPLPPVTESEQ